MVTIKIEDNAVPFTQYLLPDGRRRPVEIQMDDETVAKAQQLLDTGLRFECEVLRNGVVSFTIVGYLPSIKEEGDVDIKLVPNGSGVPDAVKEMIMGFDLDAYTERLPSHLKR